MTKEEAHDFIARNYLGYINKLVYFEAEKLTARIKAIDVIEGDHSDFVATCFLETPNEEDPEFKDHIFSHMALEEVIRSGKVVPS